MVHRSLKAAEDLAKEGISVEVVDPRTLVPLDSDTIINSIKKTGRLVVVDEGYPRCGFAADIAALAASKAFKYLKASVQISYASSNSCLLQSSTRKRVDTLRGENKECY